MKFIVFHKSGFQHSASWAYPWVEYLKENDIPYDEVDLFKVGNLVDFLRKYDALLWNIAISDYQEMLMGRNIIYTAKKMGLKVFPDFNDVWHKDDKVAETYLLEAINAPTPKSWIFYNMETLDATLSNGELRFPIVAKLKCGSGSNNVKLIKSESQLRHYAKKMFSSGINAAPSLIYKTSSHVRSSHDWEDIKKKVKRIPEFLHTRTERKKFPKEKGYVYLQSFIPNDNYDLKVIVVGDKLTAIYRPTRSHDFRASGGGEVLFNKEKITKNIIESAFATADALGSQCMGFDFVVDNSNGKGYIVEMCCGFSHTAGMLPNGWWDRNCEWHEGALNAPAEIIKNIIMCK